MANRQFTKGAIYAVAVLSAALINEFIRNYVKKYIDVQGYVLVLIDMAILVLIFAPAFALVNKYTKKLSKAYLKTSKKLSTRNRGTLIGFLIAIVILFILFAKMRHGLDAIQDLKKFLGIM